MSPRRFWRSGPIPRGVAILPDSALNVNNVLRSWGAYFMKKVEDYRRHMRECLALAKVVSNPEHRKMLFDMANSWDALAHLREERLAHERRLAS